MALILFFMAMGYSNNLIFIFFFFLISVAITGMVVTNRNVNAVIFQRLKGQEVFAGETGVVKVTFLNRSKSAVWELESSFDKDGEFSPNFSISPLKEVDVAVHFISEKRGLIEVPRLLLQSRFPFGLLRAWRHFRPEEKVLVFPELRGVSLFPEGAMNSDMIKNMGLFRDHRVYQAGDNVRRIDWKASARRQETLVKNYEEPEKPALEFTWDQTEGLDFESRISQLALWVDEAETRGFSYGLSVGKFKEAHRSGKPHWTRCLEILANLEPKDLL
jgi:Uncharacterized conserved protein (some members contain a von Willebrand factor type A (vWA) domain)